MNNEIKSVLIFDKYIVKDVRFDTNVNFIDDRTIDLDFDFDADVKYQDDRTKLEVELKATIFRDAVNNNYPFEMSVSLIGYYEIEQNGDGGNTNFESNAIAILFPYMRAIVSTFSANSNVKPVILPPMNINAFLKKKLNSKSEEK